MSPHLELEDPDGHCVVNKIRIDKLDVMTPGIMHLGGLDEASTSRWTLPFGYPGQWRQASLRGARRAIHESWLRSQFAGCSSLDRLFDRSDIKYRYHYEQHNQPDPDERLGRPEREVLGRNHPTDTFSQ